MTAAAPRRPAGRPAVPPWYSPASLAAGLPHDPAPWAAAVAGAITDAGTMGGAAVALGLDLRTLQRLVRAAREGWPHVAADIPQLSAGGWREQHATRRPRGAATTG